MAFELEVCPTAAACGARAAELLLQACRARPRRALGLATGRTMEPVYDAFVARVRALPAAERQELVQGWCSFNLDEYGELAPGDPRSFRAFMAQQLVQPLGLDPGAVQLPDGGAADPLQEARRYRQALGAAGGVGLQLLGLGTNGHVGFNEPPTAVDACCRPVVLSDATRQQNAAAFGGDPKAVPAWAISLGLAEILAAERICLLVTGSAKAPILRRLLQESPGPALPASWLHHHPAALLLADRAAMEGGSP